jgi:glutamate/tyrosine decarboxylase-like PLP-dependent enzyme
MPADGTDPGVLLNRLRDLKQGDYAWRQGRVPLYVYHHTDELLQLSQQAYLEFFTENALGQGKAFPSVLTLEREVVGMALDLLGGGPRSGGTFTSGGTESIFLAVKAARDRAGIDRPKLVVPQSGHATISKAASYLGVEVVRTSLRSDLRADVDALATAIDDRTIMLAASAPDYPHGVFDPIAEIGALAANHALWFHVDACVGGFLAPFARDIGHPIPPFDLSVPGVSSLSADIHKYGFAAKARPFYCWPTEKTSDTSASSSATGRGGAMRPTPFRVPVRPGRSPRPGWSCARWAERAIER